MAKETSKPWYTSKTAWGTLFLFLAAVMYFLGVDGGWQMLEAILGIFGIPLTAMGIRNATTDKVTMRRE